MKYLVAICLLCVTIGCSLPEPSPAQRKAEEIVGWRSVYSFEYENHDYISFFGNRKGTVVHDPECDTCFAKHDYLLRRIDEVQVTLDAMLDDMGG